MVKNKRYNNFAKNQYKKYKKEIHLSNYCLFIIYNNHKNQLKNSVVKLNVFILNCYYNNLKYHDAIIANVKLPKIISIIYNDEYSMNSIVQTIQ